MYCFICIVFVLSMYYFISWINTSPDCQTLWCVVCDFIKNILYYMNILYNRNIIRAAKTLFVSIRGFSTKYCCLAFCNSSQPLKYCCPSMNSSLQLVRYWCYEQFTATLCYWCHQRTIYRQCDLTENAYCFLVIYC